MSLFRTKVFSEEGSNERRKEESTYIMFRDLVEELEGMTSHMDKRAGASGVCYCKPSLLYAVA